MSQINLRAPEPHDTDTLYLWENDPAQWLTSFTPVHVSRQRLWDYVNNFDGDLSSWQQIKLMAETDGQTVGTVDLFDIDLHAGHAFVGVYIASEMRLRGYGTAALEAVCDYAFNVLGLNSIVAVVAVNNIASLRIFGRAGFDNVGRLASWIRQGQSYSDAVIMQSVCLK